MGVVGVIVIIAIAFLWSDNKRRINWWTVISSFLVLLLMVSFAFVVPAGVKIMQIIGDKANAVIIQGQEGAKFIFGEDLATKHGFVFAINVLVNIVYLGALFAVLYYLRIMQVINAAAAWLVTRVFRISKAESLNSVATIFLGASESLLAIRPALGNLNRSQIFTIMVAGIASAAGSVMGGYIGLGMPADYVITALLMSMPGSIFISKILCPQTEPIIDSEKYSGSIDEQSKSLLEAVGNGSILGLKLAVTVGVLIIGFISLIALLNLIIGGIGGYFGFPGLNLTYILGNLMKPLSWVMGIPHKDLLTAGYLLAEKMITNEFVAFVHLKDYMPNLDPKTTSILVFSLCGFANLGTIGMLIGSVKVLVPKKSHLFCQLAMKALIAATLVNLLNGTLAGCMIDLAHYLS